MSTMRYSGELRIRITYIEAKPGDVYSDGTLRNRNGQYRCFIRGPHETTTIHVAAPAALSHAVDSAKAFDAAAHAALSFASSEDDLDDGISAHAATTSEGWHIGRSPSKAWPQTSPEPSDLPPVLDPFNVK